MIQLGKVYEDSITGFRGVATARAEYLYGCVQIQLTSKKMPKDGKPVTHWFDEPQLKGIERGIKKHGSYHETPERTYP